MRPLLDLLVPPRCLTCSAPEHPLCADCRAALPWLRGPRCERCAMPRHPLGACPAAEFAFDAAWSPMAHEGVARELVRALKHRGRLPLAHVMAAQLAASAPELHPDAMVVAVPPHPGRRRTRGIDHAGLIAQRFARRTRRREARVLQRGHGGGRQVGARRAQRLSGRPVFRAVRDVPGHVVLVDDVHTTGATLDACARALKGRGARSVVAITYTRAL